jgi:hypothetical protein
VEEKKKKFPLPKLHPSGPSRRSHTIPTGTQAVTATPWFPKSWKDRGDAFLTARDMGISALADKGLRNLVQKVKENMFPRASEEARELSRMDNEDWNLGPPTSQINGVIR